MKTIIMIVALSLVACKPRRPTKWIGMDRSKAACAEADHTWPANRLRCVSEAKMYECVSDDGGDAWQCALIGQNQALPERAP